MNRQQRDAYHWLFDDRDGRVLFDLVRQRIDLLRHGQSIHIIEVASDVSLEIGVCDDRTMMRVNEAVNHLWMMGLVFERDNRITRTLTLCTGY